MKLLVVSHSYITAFAQQKFVEMKRQCATLKVRILTPRVSHHIFMQYNREIAAELDEDEVVTIREFFGRSHMTFLFDPIRFASVVRDFKPDRVHIEEDPYSVAGVQTVCLTQSVCPNAKISFFIWDNLARVPRFPLSIVKKTLDRYSLSRADLVVCGNVEGERLLRTTRGFHGKTAVLPQVGMDPAPYLKPRNEELRRSLGLAPDDVVVGFIGRLVPEKGVIHLLEALAGLEHARWKMLLVGSGPLQPELDAWKDRFGGRLICHPPVPHSEVPNYMRALDIFVLPSYGTPFWKEQFGLALAQAMLAGVACIGSSSGAIPDVLGGTGVIFRERSVDDLKDHLRQLIESQALRADLAVAARQHALKHYTAAAVANQYLNVFTEAA
jgi:glycosyltransferase involved in cell wall biosynthesis